MSAMASLCAGLTLVAAWVASPATAEVTLETDVTKVESTLDTGGRVKRELVPVEEVVPGEELRYTIIFTNASETPVDAERIIITNPIPDGTRYVPGTAGGEDARVEYSIDGETFSATEPPAQPEPGGAGGRAGAGAAPETAASPAPGDPVGAQPDGSGAQPDGSVGSPVRSLRWTYHETLPPGASAEVFFHVRML